MAHFAQLDSTNTVTRVIVVNNQELIFSKETAVVSDGTITVTVVESEAQGILFCKSLFGEETKWVQTSYSGNFRGKYAAIGDVYDADINEFYTPVVVSSPDVLVIGPAVETQQTVAMEAQAPVTEPQYFAPVTTISDALAEMSANESAQISSSTTEQTSGLE